MSHLSSHLFHERKLEGTERRHACEQREKDELLTCVFQFPVAISIHRMLNLAKLDE